MPHKSTSKGRGIIGKRTSTRAKAGAKGGIGKSVSRRAKVRNRFRKIGKTLKFP